MRKILFLAGAVFLFSVNPAEAITGSFCGVSISNPQWEAKTRSGTTVAVVDKDGNFYAPQSTFSQSASIPGSWLNSFIIKTSIAPKFLFSSTEARLAGTVSDRQTSFASSSAFLIRNTFGTILASFDFNGNLKVKGVAAYQGSHANCQADGNYCNGTDQETRHYYCSTGNCTYSVNSSQTCSGNYCSGDNVYQRTSCSGGNCGASYVQGCGASTCNDPDGGLNYTQASTVTAGGGCSGGSCNGSQAQSDVCSDERTLNEKYCSAYNTINGQVHDCGATSNSPFTCGNDFIRQQTHTYTCSAGACGTYTTQNQWQCGTDTDTGYTCSDDSTLAWTHNYSCSGGNCGTYSSAQSKTCGASYWQNAGCTGTYYLVQQHYHTCSSGACTGGTLHSGHTVQQDCRVEGYTRCTGSGSSAHCY